MVWVSYELALKIMQPASGVHFPRCFAKCWYPVISALSLNRTSFSSPFVSMTTSRCLFFYSIHLIKSYTFFFFTSPGLEKEGIKLEMAFEVFSELFLLGFFLV